MGIKNRNGARGRVGRLEGHEVRQGADDINSFQAVDLMTNEMKEMDLDLARNIILDLVTERLYSVSGPILDFSIRG